MTRSIPHTREHYVAVYASYGYRLQDVAFGVQPSGLHIRQILFAIATWLQS